MSSLTNFEKVKEFNTAFDMVQSSEPNRTIFDTDPSTVDLRIKLIREEFEEFVEACKTKDFGEARDAIADMLYVVYGAADAFGIQADLDFNDVHDSNMSKLCSSQEEAEATVLRYEQLFSSGESPYDSPYYYKLENQEKWVVKNRSTGKALKSINYHAVDFN